MSDETPSTSQLSSLLDSNDLIILTVVFVAVGLFLLQRWSSSSASKKVSVPKIPPSMSASKVSKASFSTSVLNLSNRGLNDLLESQNKNVIFFFGSQTGTAEDYANRLSRDAKQYGFEPLVLDLEQCDMTTLKDLTKDKLVFFVVSTYGEGEPTDNAQEAYKLFKEEDHEPDELKNLNFVVFGLGNKTYEQFNAMGRFWDSKLSELGATRIFAAGEGDDDGNLEEDYMNWKDQMWPAVCKFFGKDMDAASQVMVRQFALKTLSPTDVAPEKIYKGEIGHILKPGTTQNRPPFDMKNPYYAELKVNKELMMNADRHCMHIELVTKDTPLTYAAGDHLGIFPSNDKNEVERLAKRLGIENLDEIFTMNALDASAPKKHPFNCPTTYRTALTHYLDITHIPRTHILKALIDYAESEEDKQKLSNLISPTGKDELHKYLTQECRHLLDVLEDLPSVKPPVDLIFELLPRLQCRFYSISSSPKVHTETVSITAVLVEYTTPTKRVAKGVTTGWLIEMQNPELTSYRLPVFIRKSNFKLPRVPAKPIIMVGPGTGLAPFRGFIEERIFLKSQGKEVGPNVLFYGCRHPDQDYLYKEELEKYKAEGHVELHCAFSRLTEKKIYVQHLIIENKDRIWSLLQDGAYFYVCGDAKHMARDVHDALLKIAEEIGNKTSDEAVLYVKQLRTSGRYLEDVWS